MHRSFSAIILLKFELIWSKKGEKKRINCDLLNVLKIPSVLPTRSLISYKLLKHKTAVNNFLCCNEKNAS